MKNIGLLVLLLALSSFKAGDGFHNPKIYYSIEEAAQPGTNAERLCLGGQGLTSLPADFCKLSEMREINVSEDKFNLLPACFVNFKHLRDFTASGSSIEKLPDGFEKLDSLESLSLSSCNNLNWKDAIDKIGKLKNLKYLDLSFNDLDSLPHFESLKNINEIVLSGNKFTPDYITTMKKIFIGKKVSF